MKNNMKKLLKESGKSASSIIENADIGRTSFYDIMAGKQIPKIDTACKIAKALDSSLVEVFPDLKEVIQ